MNYNFNDYYNMWNKYGVKLTAKVEITKDILNQVHRQNELCDLIWAINAANQTNKSADSLSHTIMDQVRKFSPLLLNHKRFKKYDSVSKLEERAIRHYKTDPQANFIKRQPKISNALKDYINKKLRERNNTGSVADFLPQAEMPTWDDIQTIYRMNAKPGCSIVPERLKELIENLFQKQGRKLRPNWWEETKKIIRNEAGKNNAR